MLHLSRVSESIKSSRQAIDCIFDVSNNSDVVLINSEGKEVSFEQVYATKMDNKTYCILSPITPIANTPSGTAFVYEVKADNSFSLVVNSEITASIFQQYYQAISNM